MGAIDAWIASADLDRRVHTLLSLALERLGRGEGVDLDLAAMVERVGLGGLTPAMRAIVGVQRKAQSQSTNPLEAFKMFAERCEHPADDLPGFEQLDSEYSEMDIAAFVRDHADVFTAPIDL